MKKGKYIDHNIIMACLTGKKNTARFESIDEWLNKICSESNREIIQCARLTKEEPITA